jgi:transposase
MRQPIFVRPLTDAERKQVEAGLRSSDASVLRRCQIVLASTQGDRSPQIARALGCSDETVRKVLHAFNARGLAALAPGSRRPKTVFRAFDAGGAERLRALLHQSPRTFGKSTSVWTLELAAEVSFAHGLTPQCVSVETIRNTLKRLGVRWKRAKRWLTSPDPAYARKKAPATA